MTHEQAKQIKHLAAKYCACALLATAPQDDSANTTDARAKAIEAWNDMCLLLDQLTETP